MPLPQNWTIRDILALTYVKGINATLLKNSIESYSGVDELLEKSNSALGSKLRQTEIFSTPKEIFSNPEIEKQLEICSQKGYKIISLWDDDYPQYLKEISYPPLLIFVLGNLQKSDTTSISIVGTRKNSVYGKLTTERFSEFLATRGIIVTSGMAFGIDTIAHKSAITSGGITYAVIASGLNTISPQLAAEFAKKIVESGGAIISEYSCNTVARPGYFPQRNRIISGISKATIVIESGQRGGSLITANFAFDQGREVFAVPGNISSEKSKGTNLLIRKNIASIAITPELLWEDLGFEQTEIDSFRQDSKILLDDEASSRVYSTLTYDPMHFDELLNLTGIDVSELLVKLLNLEFKGIIRQLPGKYYIKTN
ncbi:MAG: DNA-protecting protein DprA [Ignavibacteria bacterium]|nr:DNA-protecting protein DprA [Ignavibacteria bacterium]